MFKKTTTSAVPTVKNSLQNALFLQTALLVSATVFLMVLTAYLLARSQIRMVTYDQLRTVASAKEDLLESILSRQREQIALLGDESEVVDSPAIRRLLGLEALFTVQSDRTITIVKGEIPYTLSAESINLIMQSETTTLFPIFLNKELVSYVIVTPKETVGEHLVAIFDADPLLAMALDSSVGNGNLYIGFRNENDLYLLHAQNGVPTSLYVGPFDDLFEKNVALALAAGGREGELETEDYADIKVLAAYRSVPTLGWGVMATTDRATAYAPIARLTSTMFAAGFVIIVLSVLFVLNLAKRITSPLLELKDKLSSLETKKWSFDRTIFTGNELEIVDNAAFELTGRLRDSYEHLEEKVRERTRELAEKNAQNEAVLRSIEFGLVVTDAKGIVNLVNDAMSGLTKHNAQDAVGKPFEGILTLAGKDDKPLDPKEHPINVVLQEKKTYLRVPDPGFLLVTADGQHVPIFIAVTPIMQGDTCIGTVAVFRDVTEDRRIDKLKSEFISLASHQLRTPLSAIRWYIEMLLHGDCGQIDHECYKPIEAIGVANDRMIQLVNSLLHSAKLEMGTFSINPKPIDLIDVLRSVEELFAHEVRSKGIEIKTSGVDAHVPIVADADGLKLILQNLIGNAIKYSPEKSQVEIIVTHGDKELSIVVRDQGIGIPEHQKQHIFEKLFRADNARSTDADGNGLGLYIAKIATEAMRGTITFISEEKKGTTFTFTLPQ